MAESKKKPNIFKRIGRRVNEVRLELKRVIWPPRQKLIQISAIVLTIIVLAAIFLTVISKGGHYILEKIGFYTPAEQSLGQEQAYDMEQLLQIQELED